MKKLMNGEKLLSEEENRYVIFPIQHEPFWKMYKEAEELNFERAAEIRDEISKLEKSELNI